MKESSPQDQNPLKVSVEEATNQIRLWLFESHDIYQDTRIHRETPATFSKLAKLISRAEKWFHRVSSGLPDLYRDMKYMEMFGGFHMSETEKELQGVELDDVKARRKIGTSIANEIRSKEDYLLDRVAFLIAFGELPELVLIEFALSETRVNFLACLRKDPYRMTEIDEEDYYRRLFQKYEKSGVMDLETRIEARVDELKFPWHKKFDLEKKPLLKIFSDGSGIMVDSLSEGGPYWLNIFNEISDSIIEAKRRFNQVFQKSFKVTPSNHIAEWDNPPPKFDLNLSRQSFEELGQYGFEQVYLLLLLPGKIVESVQPMLAKEAGNDAKEDSDKRPVVPKGARDSIRPFIKPDNVPWSMIAIHLTPEWWEIDIDDINADNPQEKRHYSEIGFESQSPKGKPVQEWVGVLGRLAAGGGKLKYSKSDANLAIMVLKTNERLKLFFKIEENLIEANEKGGFYKSKFKIYL